MRNKGLTSILRSALQLVSNTKTNTTKKNLFDTMELSGKLHITVKKQGQVIDTLDLENIILNNGKQKIMDALVSGNIDQIFRMAIGCDGAMTGDLFQPKIPTSTMTNLFWEVYRSDVGSSAIGVQQATFTAEFNSADVPSTSFKVPTQRIINEAMLIMSDGIAGPAIIAPASPDVDESGYSIRCFKSIPFEIADDVTITLRWTIYVR